MDKSTSMTVLRNAHLTIPTSWNISVGGLKKITFESDQYYYCRAFVNGVKTTFSLPGDQIAPRLSSASESDENWLIQPLYDFDIAGALFVNRSSTYTEATYGSSIGHLRQGELAYSWFTGTDSWFQECPQATQWRYTDGQLLPSIPSYNVSQSELQDLHKDLITNIRQSNLEGLFEWGYTAGEIYFLDWKSLENLGTLSTFVANNLDPVERSEWLPESLPLPQYLPDDDLRVPVQFNRGARLSHGVTYRCAIGRSSISFRNW